MPKERVLTLLLKAKGDYISGEKISELLGVSRAAVWKDMKQLKEDGYEIESVTKKGYRLNKESDSLSIPAINNNIINSDMYNIILLDSVVSTNTHAKLLAMEGAPEYSIVIAKEQTGGRGRRGRIFESPAGGLYMSVILRPDISPSKALSLTAYAGVAISNAIENVYGTRPSIKWINDLVMNHKKIAGILTEMSVEGESGQIEYIVLGLGINVLSSVSDYSKDLSDKVTSIYAETGKKASLNHLASSVINEIPRLYNAWLTAKPAYRQMFEDNCITLGQNVINASDNSVAFAANLDDDFGLILQYPDGHSELKKTGEVSVPGYCGTASDISSHIIL